MLEIVFLAAFLVVVTAFVGQGFPTRRIPKIGIYGFMWDLDHKLAHSDCWDIDLLADLAEVISIAA